MASFCGAAEIDRQIIEIVSIPYTNRDKIPHTIQLVFYGILLQPLGNKSLNLYINIKKY
jgi:hypothetical protein